MAVFERKHPPYAGETSAARPALASQPSDQMSLIGWRGSNNINLNFAVLDRNLDLQPKKSLPSDTSQVAPVITLCQNRWTVAWVGDNAERSINVADVAFEEDSKHINGLVNRHFHGSSEFPPYSPLPAMRFI